MTNPLTWCWSPTSTATTIRSAGVHLKPDGKVLRAANLIDGASYGGCLVKDVLVKATAAYNKNHSKSECVGFLLSTGGKKLYFACDTSETEEMKKLRAEQIDYAFLPIDGIYNMNAIEAARCAEIIGVRNATFPST